MAPRRARATDDRPRFSALGSAASVLLGLGSALGVLMAYFFSVPPNEGGYLTTREAIGVALLGAAGLVFGLYGVVAAYQGRARAMGISIAFAACCVIAWVAQMSAHATDEEPGLPGHDGGIGIAPVVVAGLGLVYLMHDLTSQRRG